MLLLSVMIVFSLALNISQNTRGRGYTFKYNILTLPLQVHDAD